MDFPYIDPVIFEVYGPIALRWYGLTYLFGITAVWYLGVRRAKQPGSLWTEEEVSDFIFYGFLGIILGGRLGYVLFYQFESLLSDPSILIYLWDGGMSFHGGLLGVIVAFWYFSRKTKKNFFVIADFIAPMVPIGLGAGRLGNFINGELWGRPVTDPDFPLAMKFACDFEQAPWFRHCDTEAIPRHPSQLYEFALEGVVLFVILYWFSCKPRPRKAVSGLFLLGYGVFRSFVELFREPDEHLREMAEFLTMGQVLSLPMILLGLYLLVSAYRNPVLDVAEINESGKKQSKGRKKKAK